MEQDECDECGHALGTHAPHCPRIPEDGRHCFGCYMSVDDAGFEPADVDYGVVLCLGCEMHGEPDQ